MPRILTATFDTDMPSKPILHLVDDGQYNEWPDTYGWYHMDDTGVQWLYIYQYCDGGHYRVLRRHQIELGPKLTDE